MIFVVTSCTGLAEKRFRLSAYIMSVVLNKPKLQASVQKITDLLNRIASEINIKHNNYICTKARAKKHVFGESH